MKALDRNLARSELLKVFDDEHGKPSRTPLTNGLEVIARRVLANAPRFRALLALDEPDAAELPPGLYRHYPSGAISLVDDRPLPLTDRPDVTGHMQLVDSPAPYDPTAYHFPDFGPPVAGGLQRRLEERIGLSRDEGQE